MMWAAVSMVHGKWSNCTLTWFSSSLSFSYTQSVFVFRHFEDNSCFFRLFILPSQHLHADTLIWCIRIEAVGWGWHSGKGVYLTLWFWLDRISQILNVRQKQSNGECLMGMFSYSFVILVVTTRIAHKVSYIHIGVRLRVARFDEQGNARALSSGTGNRYRFSRFFYI